MAKRIYHWSPHRTKKAAQKKAEQLRKKGQKVRVTKGTDVASRYRGIKWNVIVVGKRKRRRRK